MNRHTAARLKSTIGMLEYVIMGELAAIRRAIDHEVLEAEEKMPEGACEPAPPLIRAGGAGDTVGVEPDRNGKSRSLAGDKEPAAVVGAPPSPTAADLASIERFMTAWAVMTASSVGREVAEKFLTASRVFLAKGELEPAERKLEAVAEILRGGM